MRYQIEHTTRYDYAEPVARSWQLARLLPRALPWQHLVSHALQVDPPPDERHDVIDSFGNSVTHFSLHGAHRWLRVQMQCTVDVGERPALPDAAEISWETVRDAMRDTTRSAAPNTRGNAAPAVDLGAARACEPTPLVPLSGLAREFAAASLAPGRTWLASVTGLMQAIYAGFVFDAEATTVSTSVDEILRERRGVCQDFAHLMLACLRAHGLPARYVSGYLLTDPPPGQERLMGADASHAWVAAYSPWHGWVELDPTNDQLADDRYVTLGWGGDFADVAPLRGVILGGAEQTLEVSVSVLPI
ncbi:MAG: transglutaminase family protein [Rhizobacter sp.]|nr:transglutaminase family protein [Rhizobacter sp.]